MAKKGFITHEKGDKDSWVCVCGNTPTSYSFFPCDKGNEMEPVKGWEGSYICGRCGRIIKQGLLAVVGQNPNLVGGLIG